MGRSVTYKWVCDGCDDVSPVKTGPEYPSGWRRLKLGVENENYPTTPLVCETCRQVLLNSIRRGPGWFKKLLRTFGVTTAEEGEDA